MRAWSGGPIGRTAAVNWSWGGGGSRSVVGSRRVRRVAGVGRTWPRPSGPSGRGLAPTGRAAAGLEWECWLSAVAAAVAAPGGGGRWAGGGRCRRLVGARAGQRRHDQDTLNDVPGLAAHRNRRRPDDGRSSVSGLALDGASRQIGSTVASGGCDAVHDYAGRQPGSDLRKEAALCLPRGADAGASTTGTTRRCSRSLGFPGPPRPRSAIRDRLSGFVMGR